MTNNSDLENAYALIIGISKYRDPRIPELRFTRADAEGIYKLLTDPEKVGLNPDNIKLLLDNDATSFNIKNAISNWLFKNADPDSVVFIYYAGHGGVEEDRLGIEKDKYAKYLLPYDTSFDDLYSSAISNRDFNELLLTIRSTKLVIFMDSCYSGGVSERKARDLKITEDPYQKIGEGEGRIVIAASKPDQRSFEDSRLGHGIFTYNLIEALSGKADQNKVGYVTVIDAYKYLEKTVPDLARKLAGGEQNPVMRGDITKDFAISVNRERRGEIEKEREIEIKLTKLREFYCAGNFSGKLYEKLRLVTKTDLEHLQQKERDIAKLINDLCSGDILIDTFLEDLEHIEPDLFVGREKEIEEQEKLCRIEEERWKRKEKVDFEKKELEQKPEKEVPLEKSEAEHKTSEGIIRKWKIGILLLIILGAAILFVVLQNGIKSSPPGTLTPTPTPTPAITPLIETITNSIGMTFVKIPAGEFEMGSLPDEMDRYEAEGPLHTVELSKAFYMGKYEVTQKQWFDVMGYNTSFFKGENLPVEQVKWDDVQKFIKKLNEKERTNKYRLPSEAEWEYAARAGTTTNYSFGDNKSKLGDYVWYDENAKGIPHPVGEKKPNIWGLFDINGNVWEWVQDEWHDNYDDAPINGSSWESKKITDRVVRGCSFNALAKHCRPAHRTHTNQSDFSRDLGFRLVKDL